MIIKGDGITLYVDPYVSGDLDSGDWRRTFPAPIEPGDILGADLCLITHEHDDHMDGGTLPYFHRQNPAAPIVAPALLQAGFAGDGDCGPANLGGR
ncbi:hypothetical protein HMSSN036_95180 [Paenibacillus macerans]|nr:hypothetical protein HMSSN036_95180 [Paenibacillus macerans]